MLKGIESRLHSVIDERARQRSLFDEPLNEAPGSSPCEAAPPVAVSPSSDVAYALSPSQLNCYVHDCQVKWFYRYVLRLPEGSDTNRALGRAVHAALGENFRQKIDTKEDLPLEGVLAIFRDALKGELELVDGDVAHAMRDELDGTGQALIAVYMDQAAPSIDPAAVELRVAGEIGGVPVSGYIDLLDVEGNIIDVKTAAKKPAGVRADYRLQLATYAMLCPKASGRARLDTITKTKTVQLYQQTIDVIDADHHMAERLYPLAQEAMRSGLYVPNRGSMLCSRKYCGFWARCVAEYGGEVDYGAEVPGNPAPALLSSR